MHEISFLEKAAIETQEEGEERRLYPDWLQIFPHLKREPLAGDSPGRESPAPESQVVDSKQGFCEINFSRKNPPAGADNSAEIRPCNSVLNPYPPGVGEASRARQRA